MGILDDWLGARDADTAELAFTGLARREVSTLTDPTIRFPPQAGARLAAAWLERPRSELAWIAGPSRGGEGAPPQTTTSRRDAKRSWLDGVVDFRSGCEETWTVEELVHDARGVQRIAVGFWVPDESSREGGGGSGGNVIRVFDRDARVALSLASDGRTATMLAEDEKALDAPERLALARDALDLHACNRTVYVSTMPSYDAKRFAKLARALARAIDASLDERVTITETRGGDGEVERAGANIGGLEDDELAYFDGRFGMSVGLFGSLQLRLPSAKLARVLERLLREPGASVPY